jgi:ribosomal protein S18 acetylase RimI-like enzyme
MGSGRVMGIVAVSKDTSLCGYASLRYRVESAYLETIAVDNRLQNQGIGRKLLKTILLYINNGLLGEV